MTNNLPDNTNVTPHSLAAIIKIQIFTDVFGLYSTYVYLQTDCNIFYILYDTSTYYIIIINITIRLIIIYNIICRKVIKFTSKLFINPIQKVSQFYFCDFAVEFRTINRISLFCNAYFFYQNIVSRADFWILLHMGINFGRIQIDIRVKFVSKKYIFFIA